eukprot:scaffold2061_cov195-Alexandrium_tamarense.AAC.10
MVDFEGEECVVCTLNEDVRNKAGRSHNTGHKGRKRVNNLAATAPVKELGIENRMRRLIRA